FERRWVPEFLGGSSASRNLKVHKECCNFIICKWRAEPSSRITFIGIRKSLIGQVPPLGVSISCI
ncbi:unnamed protein product, partial [Musa hybrid cultivar]